MKHLRLLFLCMTVFLVARHAGAENTGIVIDLYGGYGITAYEENTNASGQDVQSRATLDAFLLGASLEYPLPRLNRFYLGAAGDWSIGLKDSERWDRDDVKFQEDDISLWSQFYEARLGYTDSLNTLSYRLYLSGGWDGVHFKRKNFIDRGVPSPSDAITEDFHLWNAGGGIALAYIKGKWTFDGKAAYAYYVDGEVRNSSRSGVVFNVDGTRMNIEAGVGYQLSARTALSLGGRYTRIIIDESEPDLTDGIIFPHSRTEIIAAIIKVTFNY